MESFNLCVFKNKPPIDELPVGKIVHFNSSKDINKNILSQGRVFYIENQGLYVRLWSFMSESNKDDGTLGLVVLVEGKKIYLEFNRQKTRFSSYKVLGGKREDILDMSQVTLEYFKGEDLEGWYWGGEIFISETFYLKHIKNTIPKIGDSIKGNLYSNIYTPAQLFEDAIGRYDFVDW